MKRLFAARYIPNYLSGYRILAFPFLMWSIFAGHRELYVWLLCINLFTDILDGQLARRCGWASEFGAKLDSLADDGTYIAAFTGIFVLEPAFFHRYLVQFIILISLFILPQIVALIRFKRATSLHLYSSKTAGYLQGIFFFTYFVFGYFAWYFHLMMAFSYLAFLEVLIITTFIPRLRSNVKGIWWMWKEHKAIR